MTSKMLQFGTLLFPLSLMTIMQVAPVYATADLSGTWSGTFNSNHEGVTPFTVTVVIHKDSTGRMIGNSSLASHCLKNAQLQVKVMDSTVVLAGSDNAGDNMTVRGSLDTTGTVLNSTYILNGSSTGGCETDDGTGSLAKR